MSEPVVEDYSHEEPKPNLTPITIIVSHPSTFLNALKAVSVLSDEASVVIDPAKNRLIFRRLDISEAFMIDLSIIPEDTDNCPSEPVGFIFRVSDFLKMFPKITKADNNERIKIVVSENEMKVSIKNSEFKIYAYDVAPVSNLNEVLPLPQFSVTISVDVDVDDFIEVLKRGSTISDKFTILVEKGELIISAKGEVSELSQKILVYGSEFPENTKASYNLSRVLLMLKALKKLKTGRIRVEFSTDMPLKISARNIPPIDHITYYVAPRVEIENV